MSRKISICFMGPSDLRRLDVREGGRVKIAQTIGQGGSSWALGRWGVIEETHFSQVMVRVDNDQVDQTWCVTMIFDEKEPKAMPSV